MLVGLRTILNASEKKKEDLSGLRLYLTGVPANTTILGGTSIIYTRGGSTWNIDYGDGVTQSGANGTGFSEHTYSNDGDYCIVIKGNISEITCPDTTHFPLISSESKIGSPYLTKVIVGTGFTELALGWNLAARVFSRNYGLKKVEFVDSGCSKLGQYCFGYARNPTTGTGLETVVFPDSIKEIRACTFYECTYLKNVVLPSNITAIPSMMFASCNNLRGIDIPSGVSSIGTNCFNLCKQMAYITCRAATPPTADTTSFNAVPKGIPVYVPSGSIELYQNDSVWGSFTDILPIEQTL